MNRYFFHFREGDELSRDRVGMYLPDVNAARDEGIRTWRDLVVLAGGGDELTESAIEITNTAGEKVLTIPVGFGAAAH